MAIAYRSQTTVTGATSTTLTINKPSGTADNDILIALVYLEAPKTVTAPSGWATVHTKIAVAADHDHHVYWKRASSEGASWQWSWSGGTWRLGFVAAFSGCITSGDPFSVAASTNSATTGSTLTHNTITTGHADCMILGIGSHWDTLAGNWSNSSSMNERIDANNMMLMEVIQAAAGATGNKTSEGASSESWGATLAALRPPSTQDTPELYGRPFGVRGEYQMRQLLAS